MALVPNFFYFEFAGFREQNTRLMTVSVETVLMARFGPSKTNQNARFFLGLPWQIIKWNIFSRWMNFSFKLSMRDIQWWSNLFSLAPPKVQRAGTCVFFFQFSHAFFFSRISTRKEHKKREINEIVMYRTEDLKTSPFRF